MPGPYNAGTVFLQVVPSFRGVQDAIEAEAKKAGVAAGVQMNQGMQAGAAQGAQKAAAKTTAAAKATGKAAGKAAADEYSGAFEKGVKSRLDKAIKSISTIHVDADTGTAEKELDQLRARLKALGDAKIGVDISAERALATIRDVQIRLKELGNTAGNVQVKVDAAAAFAELEAIQKAQRALNGQTAKVNVKVDGAAKASAELGVIGRAVKKLDGGSRDAANSFRIFNPYLLALSSLGTGAIPVMGALAGGIALVGASATGAASGLGVLILGFSGISDAVKAMMKVQDSAVKDSVSQGKTLRTANKTMRDAVQGLAEARRNAARDSQRAARDVVDAERSAADGVTAAIDRQKAAQDDLIRSQRDAKQAVLDLAQARLDAAQDIKDLQQRLQGGKLSERQAVLDLARATQHDQNVRLDPGSTNAEREQSSIDLGQAKLRLAQIREENKATADQIKKGVEGSDLVKSAQDRVTQAVQAEIAARQDLRKASAEVDQARIDGARRVADALAAQQEVAYQNQRSLRDATERVSDAQANLREATIKTGEVGSASMDALNTAMGKLSPTQQAFARWLFSLYPEFLKLRAEAAEGFLPAISTGVDKLIKVYGPSFFKFVGQISGVLGTLFTEFFDMLTTPTWQAFFAEIGKYAPEFLRLWGEITLNLMQFGTGILVALQPLALDFLQWLRDFTQGLADWGAHAGDSALMKEFLGFLRDIAPDVKEFLQALGPALLVVLRALEPLGKLVLDKVTDFLRFLATMDPDHLTKLVGGVLAFYVALQALSGLRALGAMVSTFITFLYYGGRLLAFFATGPGLIVLGIALIIGGLILLYNKNQAFHDFVDMVWGKIKDIFWSVADFFSEKVWPKMKDVFDQLGSIAQWLWVNILKPVFNAIKDTFISLGHVFEFVWAVFIKPILQFFWSLVTITWNVVLRPIFNAIGALFTRIGKDMADTWNRYIKPTLTFLGDVWEKDVAPKVQAGIEKIGDLWAQLQDMARVPIKWVVDVALNKGLIAGWNWVAKTLGGSTIDPIKLPASFLDSSVANRNRKKNATATRKFGTGPGFAAGGILPGYTPGRDVHHFLSPTGGGLHLSGGEAIMRPEWTRAMGANYVAMMNRVAKTYGVAGIRRMMDGQGFADGGVITWRGKHFTPAMVARLQMAERLAGARFSISQGGFRPATSYSGTSHRGDAVDISNPLTTLVVAALRGAGIAAWLRNPSQGPWGYHIHGVPLPGGGVRPLGSAIWQGQDYLRGGDGLGGKGDQGDSGLGAILKGLSDKVLGVISAPLDFFKDKLSGVADHLKKYGKSGEIMLAGMNKLAHMMADKVKDMAVGIGDVVGLGNASNGKDAVKQAAAKYGWDSGGMWVALQKLVNGESGFNPTARNASSGAYGMFQFLDSTWGSVGGRKTSDPNLQALYGLRYIAQRYGNPANAWSKWESRSPHWYADGGIYEGRDTPQVEATMYDNGGMLPPGLSTVLNLTGKPEPVFTSAQWDAIRRGGGDDGGFSATINATTTSTAREIADEFNWAYTKIRRGGVYARG